MDDKIYETCRSGRCRGSFRGFESSDSFDSVIFGASLDILAYACECCGDRIYFTSSGFRVEDDPRYQRAKESVNA